MGADDALLIRAEGAPGALVGAGERPRAPAGRGPRAREGAGVVTGRGRGRSIIYGNYDFGRYTTAEVRLPPPTARAESTIEDGRGLGLDVLSSALAPREVRVRLFLDAGAVPTAADRERVRDEMSGYLALPQGAALMLPGPSCGSRQLKGAMLTDASAWDSLFEDGECELAFTAYDPVMYGGESFARSPEGEASLVVENTGSAPVRPTVSFYALPGGSVTLRCNVLDSGAAPDGSVTVRRAFEGGERVWVYNDRERVAAGGEDADADVDVSSVFCEIPGGLSARFEVDGGTGPITVTYTKGWL